MEPMGAPWPPRGGPREAQGSSGKTQGGSGEDQGSPGKAGGGRGGMCGTFSMTKGTRKVLRNAPQDVAIQCSRFIFLCRYHKQWEQKHYEMLG